MTRDERDSNPPDDDHADGRDMTDPNNDPFHPPSIPTLVHCLHCDEEYDSYLIEYLLENVGNGKKMGFWSCPTPGCDGKGFGFDILPVDEDWVDPDGRDMGWDHSDDEDEADADDDDDDEPWRRGEGGGTSSWDDPGGGAGGVCDPDAGEFDQPTDWFMNDPNAGDPSNDDWLTDTDDDADDDDLPF